MRDRVVLWFDVGHKRYTTLADDIGTSLSCGLM